MTNEPSKAQHATHRGVYSRPTLSIYGGVVGLTAAGTAPPAENNGTGGAVKKP